MTGSDRGSVAHGNGRVALVTGAAGFKGRWLMDLLSAIGFEALGWDRLPPAVPGTYEWRLIDLAEPFEVPDHVDLVFHLAAQSLVPIGYENPRATWTDNLMVTINLLEAIRSHKRPLTAIVVTSDKVYRLPSSPRRLHEDDELGGYCPYSSSKAACELAVESYRSLLPSSVNIATVRAGNVIGGADHAKNRLVPDIIRAAQSGHAVELRNPASTRPWLFVLDCLWGYITMAAALAAGSDPGPTMNFGPMDGDELTVGDLATTLSSRLGSPPPRTGVQTRFNEAPYLQLETSRARERLGWRPHLTSTAALDWIVEWAEAVSRDPNMSQAIAEAQIDRYLAFVN